MDDYKINEIIKEATIRIIKHTSNEWKINTILKKHKEKIHFVPLQYRIFGGLLQSLNIQFGNYIEELIHLIAEREPYLEIIKDFSGKKNIKIHLSNKSDTLIDNYISECQNNHDITKIDYNFTNLIKMIFVALTGSNVLFVITNLFI